MVRTRNTNELHGEQPEGSRARETDSPLGTPPPPPPSNPMQMMAQFFASMMESQQQQAEFMREVARQNLAPRNARGHHDGAPQNSSYSDFLATRPPTFSSTTEPMEAENFLRMLESKFGLLNCTPVQKTLFAAQQLHGAAGAWWANHVASMGTDRQITWGEFKDAFRAHYIPAGLVRRKAREFAALKQGNRSVEEYCEEFNRLALYAPEQVDTPAKRKDRFLEGLSAELQDRLNLNMGGTFAEFVNNAIVAEDGYRRVMAERKRSASAMGPSNGPPQKFRMVYTTPSGQSSGLIPNNFCKGSRLKGVGKRKEKENCPRDPPVSDPEKTQLDRSHAARADARRVVAGVRPTAEAADRRPHRSDIFPPPVSPPRSERFIYSFPPLSLSPFPLARPRHCRAVLDLVAPTPRRPSCPVEHPRNTSPTSSVFKRSRLSLPRIEPPRIDLVLPVSDRRFNRVARHPR
ncbi:hypothetical protein PR202_ga22591 [Eleusine coracana subsp. coracana]|uniref:Retrotransposon gag domain-containing protein n=1 Tax=Eleusine coracana subsp. coracana TaxID=191504 RepID=A0AAV5D415_ELECO|nr:hypothetical protein PR202_ga22591 [Eleusine coracana subsp. coracana]